MPAPRFEGSRSIAEKLRERVEEERRRWDAIPTVKDFQCAWELWEQQPGAQPQHVGRCG